MPACSTCHDDKIIQDEGLFKGDEVVWSEPCPDCPREVPRINPDTAEGAALLAAYGDLKRLEARKGEWPGGDVVDIVAGLFTKLGFDLEREVDEVEEQLRGTQHKFTVVGLRDQDTEDFLPAAVLAGDVRAVHSDSDSGDFQRQLFTVNAADPDEAEQHVLDGEGE